MKKIVLISVLFITLFSAYSKNPVVSILGDSYSTFQGYVEPDTNLVWYHSPRRAKTTDVDSMQQTWWGIITSPDSAWTLGVNNSYSGSTICRTGYNGDDYTDRAFISRMDNLGNPDIILVFGGTNDSWANSPIGDYIYSDWTDEQLYSFRPAMARLMDGLKGLYPEANVYFILNTELKTEINASVYTICEHYNVPVITLHDIDKQHGHPNIKGMRSIAEQVSSNIR
ncbi:MAG: SGNH/GDSL hydrolase family protein [Muribaculaceae bacterium]|nr:SGNH/GDSL hydrolase family protein [Muribaculaceae bacterium]